MTTVLALAFSTSALVPVVALMAWWRTDGRRRYYRLRRPPIRVPVALALHHHGRLAAAFVDWSAWSGAAAGAAALPSGDWCAGGRA